MKIKQQTGTVQSGNCNFIDLFLSPKPGQEHTTTSFKQLHPGIIIEIVAANSNTLEFCSSLSINRI